MSDRGGEAKRSLSQWITLVLLVLVIPALLVALAVRYSKDRSDDSTKVPSSAESPGVVQAPDSRAPPAQTSAKEIYRANCAACHDIDMPDLWPRFGKARDWAERNERGLDALVKIVTEGNRFQPAFGGRLSHEEIVRVVVYMARASGANFDENEKASREARIAALASHPGKILYETACQACHGTGVAGAPKFGDKAAWAARIKQGNDTLVKHTIEGFKGMSAKGGSAAPDAEIKAAVEYMAAAAK